MIAISELYGSGCPFVSMDVDRDYPINTLQEEIISVHTGNRGIRY
mgnify:CR=1 FL=1